MRESQKELGLVDQTKWDAINLQLYGVIHWSGFWVVINMRRRRGNNDNDNRNNVECGLHGRGTANANPRFQQGDVPRTFLCQERRQQRQQHNLPLPHVQHPLQGIDLPFPRGVCGLPWSGGWMDEINCHALGGSYLIPAFRGEEASVLHWGCNKAMKRMGGWDWLPCSVLGLAT